MSRVEREQFKFWEKDLVTLLEVLEERDDLKDRFEALRKLFESLLMAHRHCAAPCETCGTRPTVWGGRAPGH
ncbi:hypothetical protein AURDEDRAFT_172264 [Auricularia subglabra TFB-10046 SS5]|nr:hypothetical protein AURDEDRAFT_172264 [Auricularia subglabra TFB-10046 SS5]